MNVRPVRQPGARFTVFPVRLAGFSISAGAAGEGIRDIATEPRRERFRPRKTIRL